MSHFPLARAPKRRVLLSGIAALAASAGATVAAQPASAAFTLGACQGASGVAAQGASFQNGAQTYFRGIFNGSNGCNGSPTAPTYKSNGSGNGIAAMGGAGGNADLNGGGAPLAAGVRDVSTSFAATDDPPSVAQQAAMNTGGPSASDDGTVHVIPVATGSSPVIVHAPEGCNLATVTDKTNGASGMVGGANTQNSSTDKTQRPQIENVDLERAFAGESGMDTWGELTPGISGTTASPQQLTGTPAAQRACADVPVKRIVRQDRSGTTFSFKAYLNLINPDRGWLTTYVTPDNLSWPTNGTGTTTPLATGPSRPNAFCPDSAPARLCSGTASGNGSLADAVIATDGSIGYSDLAAARGKGFTITPSDTVQDYTFWLPLQNNPGGTPTGYSEPTLDPAGNRSTTSARGANCQNVAVANVPTPANSPNGDPTLGDWSKVFAAGGPVYGACVLTYILAWDDNAPVYGNTPAEEGKARTTKDFLATIVGGFGQAFTGVDYSPLPNPQIQPLQTYAQNAVNAIGWNKTAASGGGTPPPPPPGPPAPQPGPPAPGPGIVPVVVKPSNVFTVGTGVVNKARTSLSYSVRLPGAGRLTGVASYKRGTRTIRIATVNATATAAGTARLTVRLTSAARAALKKSRRLAVTVRFTFTPAGGDAASRSKTTTVRPAAKKATKRA